mgnify:CR=1 FL=1
MNMAKPNILVVDCDEGFGLMLKEGLESSGLYSSHWVQTGGDALQSVIEVHFDLVIIDSGLVDMTPTTLVKAIREAKSEMRIMIIPLIGQSVPKSIDSLEVNGILTKPFFVGDLPDLIDRALGRPSRATLAPVEEVDAAVEPVEVTELVPSAQIESASTPVAASTATVSAPLPAIAPVANDTIRYLRANETKILRLLDDLNREVRAEAILLIAGAELIAQAGMLPREQCQKLAKLVAQSAQAAAEAASFLGEPAGRFQQSLHEGEAYRLYSLSLGQGIVLSLALSSNVPLGMIRHQSRQTADQLARFI